jgi:hypothetical protein
MSTLGRDDAHGRHACGDEGHGRDRTEQQECRGYRQFHVVLLSPDAVQLCAV